MSFDFSINLANINIEDETTCMGIIFIPVNCSYSTSTKEHSLSFTTLFLYWNLYNLFAKDDPFKGGYDTDWIVGPFFSIQTLYLISFHNFNREISYSFGIKISRRGHIDKIIGFCPNLDIGYKQYNEKHSIFITLDITLLVPIMLGIFSLGGF